MWRDRDVTVTVDGHPTNADVYLGQPTYYVSEAYMLVHVPNVGEYLLNFDTESCREASEHEYTRGEQRVWFWKPMQEGRFESPSHMGSDEYFIVSHGHLLTIQF